MLSLLLAAVATTIKFPRKLPNPNPNPSLTRTLTLTLTLTLSITLTRFPHKLAFIIIHTDQYGVSAEQASPQLVMGGL